MHERQSEFTPGCAGLYHPKSGPGTLGTGCGAFWRKFVENYKIAEEDQLPICQDTGVACVFLEVGQEVHIQGDLEQAIHAGVRQGYLEAGLRCSVVADPLRRVNTKDNTPACIYTRLVPGDQLKITVAPKGAGSENMSRIAMLRPSDGAQGVKDFVVKTVAEAGPNPCPPIVVGVGIGGGFDRSAELAKRALLRPAGSPNPIPSMRRWSRSCCSGSTPWGIGPQGFGGQTTALASILRWLRSIWPACLWQ